jgi:hypothetical protein
MAERELCVLCEKRPPRRQCPGVHGDICPVCCGTEREQTIDCPFECEYLRDARRRERVPPPDPATLPCPEIDVTDAFLQEHRPLMVATGRMLLAASLQTPGAVDFDVRDALDALVRTLKTADSGLVYTTRPANVIAAQIQDRFQAELQRFREELARRTGSHSVRDRDVLGILVFWRRMQWRHNNGRRKGRAFIESLFSLITPAQEQAGTPSAAR